MMKTLRWLGMGVVTLLLLPVALPVLLCTGLDQLTREK